ncbi:hypothetical protein ACU19_04630 [Actinobaculum suis]|nr:hypothetical protein ACU19_04630 [Actinobaculum suis]
METFASNTFWKRSPKSIYRKVSTGKYLRESICRKLLAKKTDSRKEVLEKQHPKSAPENSTRKAHLKIAPEKHT